MKNTIINNKIHSTIQNSMKIEIFKLNKHTRRAPITLSICFIHFWAIDYNNNWKSFLTNQMNINDMVPPHNPNQFHSMCRFTYNNVMKNNSNNPDEFNSLSIVLESINNSKFDGVEDDIKSLCVSSGCICKYLTSIEFLLYYLRSKFSLTKPAFQLSLVNSNSKNSIYNKQYCI